MAIHPDLNCYRASLKTRLAFVCVVLYIYFVFVDKKTLPNDDSKESTSIKKNIFMLETANIDKPTISMLCGLESASRMNPGYNVSFCFPFPSRIFNSFLRSCFFSFLFPLNLFCIFIFMTPVKY